MIYVGIDPGASGGMAWPVTNGRGYNVLRFKDKEFILSQWKQWSRSDAPLRIVLEQVHAMPKNGVSGMFKFGQNFGWWQGVVESFAWDYELVTPQKWQRHLGCMTNGDKNVTKAFAAELVEKSGSSMRVTHTIADAICLAEYARRTA